MPLRRVAVFAGSAPPTRPAFGEAATRVGALLAQNGITLLTEGVSAGLEEMLIEAARGGGGTVAVMPRDAAMVEKADALVILPQGLATLDELFQLWSWQSPADAEKPSGLLNVGGYFTTLLESESDAAVERFVRETQRGMLVVDPDPEALFRSLADFRPPETRRSQPRDDE
jgi:predicted Rossmann-fold nucleotide-binding protein